MRLNNTAEGRGTTRGRARDGKQTEIMRMGEREMRQREGEASGERRRDREADCQWSNGKGKGMSRGEGNLEDMIGAGKGDDGIFIVIVLLGRKFLERTWFPVKGKEEKKAEKGILDRRTAGEQGQMGRQVKGSEGKGGVKKKSREGHNMVLHETQ